MSRKSLVQFVFVIPIAILSGCGAPPEALSASHRGGPRIAGITCAPFARELSGIALYGDAGDWWESAAGRYRRATEPQVGSVLVLRRQGRLASGHVSVVSRLLAARQIEVIQANWVAGELDLDQLVVDVSADNDWSLVRVWWPPSGQLGTHEYESFGFIRAPAPVTHDQLFRAAPVAARLSLTSMRGRPLPRARAYGG